MSEQPGYSYYEVALTNRQALGAFATLLALVLGAFAAGVAVGLWADDGAAEVAAAQAEDEAAVLGAAPLRPQPELALVAAAADTSTTLVEDVTGRPQAAPSTTLAPGQVAAAEDEVAAAAEPDATLAQAAEPVEAEPVVLPRVETKAPAAAPAAAPRLPRAEPAAAAPIDVPAGAFVVQVLATADRGKADQLVRRLEAAGYAAFLSPAGNGAERTYRVRIGPFPTREAANPVAARVDRQFKVTSWVTPP